MSCTLKIATSRGELQVNRAAAADFDAVYAIIAEAAAWLQSRDISQWNWFLTDPGKDLIRHRIETAETYLVLDPHAQPVATFTVQWDDEMIWGPRGKDGTAGYVHGLAVRRRAAGIGLGLQMLEWSSNLIAQESRRLIRLDCMAKNESLCNYYRRAGFTDAGINDALSIGASQQIFIQLFERPIRSVSSIPQS
ncbi:MAG: GNAT family N-acetyltransferase [Tepidisphaeraceae bacterium]